MKMAILYGKKNLLFSIIIYLMRVAYATIVHTIRSVTEAALFYVRTELKKMGEHYLVVMLEIFQYLSIEYLIIVGE